MLLHLFKLIWNKKKQNFLLLAEILVSFIVIFVVSCFAVYYYTNYKKPVGFDYNNVWSISYEKPAGMSNKDSLLAFKNNLKRFLVSLPEVSDVGFSSGNVPYGYSTISTSIFYQHTRDQVNRYTVDDHYQGVLHFTMKEGRWFSAQDNTAREIPIVINETLEKKFFNQEPGLGKLFQSSDEDPKKMRVVGVITDLKDKGDFVSPGSGFYQRFDSSNVADGNTLLIKVKPVNTALFEKKLFKLLPGYLSNTNIDIKHLDKNLAEKNRQTIVPVIILLIIAGFLVSNVALGLFGVLWYTINVRKGEIGLRRAIGASKSRITLQLVGETMVLASLSLLVGSVFIVQLPLLHVFDLPAKIYLIAQLLAVVFIYLLVFVCAWYPGKQAAGVYPAKALHED